MTNTLLGEALALASAGSFAFANVFIARTSQSGGDRGVMFSVLMTMAISALLWLGLEGGVEGGRLFLSGLFLSGPSLTGLGWFALAGVSAMVFGRSLLYESVRRLGVGRSSAVKRLNPFFSVILAALILGEQLQTPDVLGVLAIATAFGVLIRESLRRRGGGDDARGVGAYMFGVAAALAYALAYIMRKLGLDDLSSPALGTLVSAMAGFAFFCAMSIVSAKVRHNLGAMFRYLDRWVVLASVFVSLGQILLFSALAYAEVSTVVMIASLEVFIAIFLSVVIFRTERRPTVSVMVSAVLATLGVALVAW